MTEQYNIIPNNIDKSKKRHSGKIDSFIGEKLRNTRILLGITQSQLSQKIGITFQQLQKYENGSNRISAATIFALSNIFHIDVADFFPLYKIKKSSSANEIKKPIINNYNTNKEIVSLLSTYNKIKNEKTKKRILSLVQQIANDV